MLQLIIDNGADLEARNNEGETPLHAASKTSFDYIVKVHSERLKRKLGDLCYSC